VEEENRLISGKTAILDDKEKRYNKRGVWWRISLEKTRRW